MLDLKAIHHVAIICSDYSKSKHFYTNILGLKVLSEHYRADRNSYKLDLGIENQYCIELFSFPDPPIRQTRPESCGLRHLAFCVNDIKAQMEILKSHGIIVEEIRTDEFTNKKFLFFQDPDGLPIELYEK
jgi:glyoxylase I family protein